MRNRANEKDADIKVNKYGEDSASSAYDSKSEPVRKKTNKKNTSGSYMEQSFVPNQVAYDASNLPIDSNGYSIQNILNFAQQYNTPALKSKLI